MRSAPGVWFKENTIAWAGLLMRKINIVTIVLSLFLLMVISCAAWRTFQINSALVYTLRNLDRQSAIDRIDKYLRNRYEVDTEMHYALTIEPCEVAAMARDMIAAYDNPSVNYMFYQKHCKPYIDTINQVSLFVVTSTMSFLIFRYLWGVK